jgi:hypothetical protein
VTDILYTSSIVQFRLVAWTCNDMPQFDAVCLLYIHGRALVLLFVTKFVR